MGKIKELYMDLEEGAQQAIAEQDSIEILRQAANDLHGVCLMLQVTQPSFDATFLPVMDAVRHIMSSLQNDAKFLETLANVCEEQKKVA